MLYGREVFKGAMEKAEAEGKEVVWRFWGKTVRPGVTPKASSQTSTPA